MFWRVFKTKRKEAPSFTWLDRLHVASRAWGLRISGWLQRKTQGLSPGQLKRYSVLVLLVGVGWNGWMVFQALQQPRSPFPVQQLPLSHPILPSVRPPVDPSSLESIRKFRSWLDSLRADTVGRRIYDTILRQRPGLLDSLGQIEKAYSIHH